MQIDWSSSLVGWEPSKKYTQKVEDDSVIDGLVQRLLEIASFDLEPQINLLRPMDTPYELQRCGFSEVSICEHAARQLELHRKLWETHTNQDGNKAFEMPVAVAAENELKYFKIIFEVVCETKINECKSVWISFHSTKLLLEKKL